ncbi:MAG: hypothetical protein V1865_00330 [bacterium]
MSKKKFAIDEAFEYGWDAMKPNFWFFAAILAFVFIIYGSLSFLMDHSGSVNWVLRIIYYIICIIFSIGLVKIALNIYNKKRNKFLDIVNSFELFVDYLFATVIYGVIVSIGLVLLIFPGIMLMTKLMFYPYFIVDKKMGPIAALKASWKVTIDHKGIIFLFWLMTSLINLIGLLVVGIGLFVSMPVTMMAQVYVFKKLSGTK